MTKNNIFILLTAVLLGGGLLWYGSVDRSKDESLVLNGAQEQTALTATVEIIGSEGVRESFLSVDLNEGETALEVTGKVIAVKTSGEGENAFVTAIGDIEADSSRNEFWSFMINSEPSMVGAGSYAVQDGDTISWELSTY